jgi:hypothetical protein
VLRPASIGRTNHEIARNVRPVWEAQVSAGWEQSRQDRRSLGSTHAPALDESEVQSPAAWVLKFALGLSAEPFQLVGIHQ